MVLLHPSFEIGRPMCASFRPDGRYGRDEQRGRAVLALLQRHKGFIDGRPA